MLVVYLSGPINSPIPGFTVADCRQAFDDLEAWLGKNYGNWEVISPLKVGTSCKRNDCGPFEGHSWECWLKADLKVMLNCDAICLLPNWADSRGVRLEHSVAKALGFREFKAQRNGPDEWTIKETGNV